MEPFLKWAGGKRWLISRLIHRLPEFNNYYEPFAGSACMFFALEPEKAVLADANEELISCYRGVRNHCQSVIQVLRRLRADERTYYRVRDKLYLRGDRIERAAYFIYLNKTCWNGLYRVNSSGHFNVPIGRRETTPEIFSSDHLLWASRQLKKAKLLVADFETAIMGAGPRDLVYFDPPYITTHMKNGFIKYNSKLFHHVDELRLARVASDLARAGVSVIVSNAAHPLIKQMYDGPFYKMEIERASLIAADAAKRARFSELLITSFPLRESDHQ